MELDKMKQPKPASEPKICPANIGEVIELLSVWAGYGTFKPHWPTVNLANAYLRVLSRHPEVSPEVLGKMLGKYKRLKCIIGRWKNYCHGISINAGKHLDTINEISRELSEIEQAADSQAKEKGAGEC